MTIKPIDLLDRIRGWCCPTNLAPDPFVQVISSYLDCNDHERGERINGVLECPHCGLYWPIIEEPEAWTQRKTGTWRAVEWGPGIAECLQCNRVFVDTFDGCFELKV